MERFTQSVHNVIGDHKKAIISGETLNDDGIYYNAFFETSEEIEGLTYPWDRNLGIPLEEQNDKTLTLDDYAGAQVVLLGKDIPFWTHVSSMLNIWMVKSRSTQQMPDQCQQWWIWCRVDWWENWPQKKGYSSLGVWRVFYIWNHEEPVITTKGWDIQIKWKDSSYDWLPLSQVKEAMPVKLAEYLSCRRFIGNQLLIGGYPKLWESVTASLQK